MSDTMLLGILRMPFDLAMETPIAQIQYHNRGVQAADEIERQRAELDKAQRHIEMLQAKLDAEKSCACAYDDPNEVCLPHSPLLEKARAEIEQLQRSFDDGYLMLEATQQANDQLRSKNELLREALRWYADPLNHSPVKCRFPGDPDPSVVFLMELPPIINDGGHRARQALDLEGGS